MEKKEEYKIDFEKAEDYLKRRDFKQAIKEFEMVLKKWPNDPRSYSKLGVCYASLKKIDKAKLYFEKSLGLDVKYAEPYNNLGNIYLEKRIMKEPLSYIRKP